MVSNMTDAVKPLAQDCPFCGKGARTWEDEFGFRGASCSNAECSASELIMTIEQWNRRTPPAGWKPIETAPTDGTQILVTGGKFGSEEAGHEFWADDYDEVAHVSYWDGLYRRVGDSNDAFMPSLWTDLPAAPENDDE